MKIVQFEISSFTDLSNPKYRSLLNEAFGITREELPLDGRVTVVTCTAEQFATFIIRRNDYGFRNEFKSLKPKIIHQEQVIVRQSPVRIDASSRR